MRIPLEEGLKRYLPETSLPVVMGWLRNYNVLVKISRRRASKLGDYRPPAAVPYHRISINRDLHPYEFLITLTHEIAHMMAWETYHGRLKPHGKRWQDQYASLLRELTGKGIFPSDLEPLIADHLAQPGSYSKSNLLLARALHARNAVSNIILLEELPDHSRFRLPDGRQFIKQQKLRKWYRCQSLDNGRTYRVSPVTPVTPVEN
jgi:hypothetical protein